jgi:hypothetical protein
LTRLLSGSAGLTGLTRLLSGSTGLTGRTRFAWADTLARGTGRISHIAGDDPQILIAERQLLLADVEVGVEAFPPGLAQLLHHLLGLLVVAVDFTEPLAVLLSHVLLHDAIETLFADRRVRDLRDELLELLLFGMVNAMFTIAILAVATFTIGADSRLHAGSILLAGLTRLRADVLGQ